MRSTDERLEDILESIRLIEAHMPQSREAYDADVVIRYFLLKQVEIVGEAAFKIDKAFKDEHPEIPWRKIEGTRHILVHDYFDVDWGVLWDIIQLHIEPLKTQVEIVLHGSGGD